MSNNNNRNQQSPTTSTGTPTDSPKQPEKDLLKEAVLLCLRILLRAAIFGSISRSHESDIKHALDGLE